MTKVQRLESISSLGLSFRTFIISNLERMGSDKLTLSTKDMV